MQKVLLILMLWGLASQLDEPDVKGSRSGQCYEYGQQEYVQLRYYHRYKSLAECLVNQRWVGNPSF